MHSCWRQCYFLVRLADSNELKKARNSGKMLNNLSTPQRTWYKYTVFPLYKIPYFERVIIYESSLVYKGRWNRMFAFLTALFRRGFVFKQDRSWRYSAIKSTKFALSKCLKAQNCKRESVKQFLPQMHLSHLILPGFFFTCKQYAKSKYWQASKVIVEGCPAKGGCS